MAMKIVFLDVIPCSLLEVSEKRAAFIFEVGISSTLKMDAIIYSETPINFWNSVFNQWYAYT
jgi:hypothetical protein